MLVLMGYDHTGKSSGQPHLDVNVVTIEKPDTAQVYAKIIRDTAPGMNPEVIFVVGAEGDKIAEHHFRRGQDYQ